MAQTGKAFNPTDLLSYWEQRYFFRPFFSQDCKSYECLRSVPKKPLLPWQDSKKSEEVIFFEIFLGNYSVSQVTEGIYISRERHIPSDEEARLERYYSHLCTFVVDSEGAYVSGTFRIIPFMFLAGKLHYREHIEIKPLLGEIEKLNERFDETLSKDSNIDFEYLEKLDINLLSALKLSAAALKSGSSNKTNVYTFQLTKPPVIYNRFMETAPEKKDPSHRHGGYDIADMLPYRRGKLEASEKLINNNPTEQLLALTKANRPDAASTDSTVFETTKPTFPDFIRGININMVSPGIWPGAEDTDAVQQYALNRIIGSDSAIQFVSTPPGTDANLITETLIMSRVIRNARFLSDIENADSVLEERKHGDFTYYTIPEELKRGTVVVLSSNDDSAYNAALSMDHFRNEAFDHMTGSDKQIYGGAAALDTAPSWGLPIMYISNRHRMERASKGNHSPGLSDLEGMNDGTTRVGSFEFVGMRKYIEEMFKTMESKQRWDEVRSAFAESHTKLMNYRDELSADQSELVELPKYMPQDIYAQIEKLEKKFDEQNKEYKKQAGALEVLREKSRLADDDAKALQKEINEIDPGLFNRKKNKKTIKYNDLLKTAEKYKEDISLLENSLDRIKQQSDELDSKITGLRQLLTEVQKWLSEQEIRLKIARAKHPGASVINADGYKRLYDYIYDIDNPDKPDLKLLEKAPFMTDEYSQMSRDLLIDALEVIKVFMRSSEKLKKNVRNALWLLEDESAQAGMPADACDNLFASFLVVIPVFSMSKQYFQSMFRNISDNSLPLTIITDSGKWRPEDISIELLKSRKIVMLGDNGSQNISSDMPTPLSDVISEEHDSLPDKYKVESGSLFRMLCPGLGENSDTQLMTVRKCDESSFNFINLTYKDRLILLDNHSKSSRTTLKKSVFYDVDDVTAGKHTDYVARQGRYVLSLFNDAVLQFGPLFFEYPFHEFYIVSPFDTVISGLMDLITTRILASLPEAAALIKDGRLKTERISSFIYKFKMNNMLTMPLFENKPGVSEVVMVLGCDRYSKGLQSAGNDIASFNRFFSKVWDTVAIIGSSAVWGKTPLFQQISKTFKIEVVE